MTRSQAQGDAGQAFPIYLTVVAGLLFLAFAYFAVGQAAVNRNGAQTAADAAALAAAQETRDGLAGLWVEDVLDPTKWQDILDGDGLGLPDPCWRARELAAQNDATVNACDPQGLRFRVTVQANKTAGESVIPATSTTKAHADAVAVIEPLCTFDPPAEDAEVDVLPKLTCEDGEENTEWELDPDDLGDLPRPEDLFYVHLAD
ncbi:pilus assembly protein TadG-related protein [Streptomyces bobili]|uniref:pilus assembly protein TadG-related protein n=1 Tax=Streptomyces bobili TaxID=67280 RepID=UPI000A37550B|nr:pilus assembly protein TadG-related protein [Streptomyces bobili]